MTYDPRLYNNQDYREGRRAGWDEGYKYGAQQAAARTLGERQTEGINRRASLKKMREHPLGRLNVEAIHMRSGFGVGVEHRISNATVLTFQDTGEESGIAVFDLSRTYGHLSPTITGMYTFDQNDPRRSQPLLKAFQVDMTHKLWWQDHRMLVTNFAARNGMSLWFWRDRRPWLGNHEYTLNRGADLQYWWNWGGDRTKTKKEKAAWDAVRRQHQGHLTKYLRATDCFDVYTDPGEKHNVTATFAFDVNDFKWKSRPEGV